MLGDGQSYVAVPGTWVQNWHIQVRKQRQRGGLSFCILEVLLPTDFPLTKGTSSKENTEGISAFWQERELMNIFSMWQITATASLLNRRRTPTKELIKSGPVSSVSFKEIASNLTEQSVYLAFWGGIPHDVGYTTRPLSQKLRELVLHHLCPLCVSWRPCNGHNTVCLLLTFSSGVAA